jgi:hypothetical protein
MRQTLRIIKIDGKEGDRMHVLAWVGLISEILVCGSVIWVCSKVIKPNKTR